MQVATMSSDSDMVVKRLSVPMGLEELMESLTKEVLRRKPSDIYAFASEHFAQLLEIRDQGNMRGSLRRLKKTYSQTSYDTSESLTNRNNQIKVKSATFGSMVKRTDRATNANRSPAPKSMLTKKNVPIKNEVPVGSNSSGKTGKQERTKSIMEKRRAGKRNMEESKKKLESQGQPVELESKKVGEVSRKSDVGRRRHSVAHRKEDKESVENIRSRSSSKGKIDDISKPTTERTRRKSNASKSTKKLEEHDKTKLSTSTDELKTSKVSPIVEKISPRTRDGKRRMSKDMQKTKLLLPEMAEVIVSGEGEKMLTVEQSQEPVPDSSKHEEPVLTKVTEISDDIVTQMGHESAIIEKSSVMDSTENVEKGIEASNIDMTQVESQNLETDDVSAALEVSKSEELELAKEDVVTREESFTETAVSTQHNQEVNFQKSNSESLNIDSEDTDKISESKIDLILKNIDDNEKLEPPEELEGKVTKISTDFSAADQEYVDDVQPEEIKNNKKEIIIIEKKKVDAELKVNDARDQVEELEQAAVKIQSLIRGHLIRKMMTKNLNSGKGDESVASIKDAAVEITPGENAGKSIPEVYKIKEEINLAVANNDKKMSKNDSNKENFSFEDIIDNLGAVIKMQALVRGYLARKFLNKNSEQGGVTSPVDDGIQKIEVERIDEITQAEAMDSNVLKQEIIEPEKTEQKELQTDQLLGDFLPNINAITKIQSVVRGFLTRKSILKTSSIQDSSTGHPLSEEKQNLAAETINHETSMQQTAAPADNINEVNGSTANDLVENKLDPKHDIETNALKEQTSDFLESEFIHYDSSRYDDPMNASNEESLDMVKDALDIKPNGKELEIKTNLEERSDHSSEKETTVEMLKFNSNEAFGDDVKPRANSIEKLADIPNCANDAATKIQSIWRGHRMRRAVRSMKYDDLQKPPECDELPHQRSSPEDAKKAAIIIQALFRGYMARKRYESADRRLLKKRNFAGSLPTLMEVEGEDNKYSTSSSDHERIEETSSATSHLEEICQTPLDTSESSASGGHRTISDEEVFAILKQLDDTPIPTDQPRRKSKMYTRSLTFDDPLTQHTNANVLTKSMTFVMGDEFQRFDTNDSLRSVGTDYESLSTESETKLLEETNHISEITSAIKEDVQKLKKTLEDGVEIKEISDDKKQDNRNIAEITKSICEDVVQLEKTLSDDTVVDSNKGIIGKTAEPTDASTRPVSKDSVTSTDSVDTVIFNGAYKKDLLNQTDLKEDVLDNISKKKLPTEESPDLTNNAHLQRLDAVIREGDTLVTDILNTAKDRLQNEEINNQFFEQDPIPQIASDKRQSTTSDELRQLWQDEAATTIQKSYRGYRVRRDLETQPHHADDELKKATEDSVNKEITRYLNQITAPIRRAFSADKSSAVITDKEKSSNKRVHSASLETPKATPVYIPLRDYSEEEKDVSGQIADIIVPDNLNVSNIEELNNNNQAVKNEELAKKELTVFDIMAETVTNRDESDKAVAIESAAIEEESKTNTDSKADEVEQEASDKISACISAVVAPITKRFQPVESFDEKATLEIVPRLVDTEPVYHYIPLRNYSEEESKENESPPVRREELNVSANVEAINEVSEVPELSQNTLSETIEEETVNDNLPKNANDGLNKNLKFDETDAGVNEIAKDIELPAQNKEEYVSKEINEYIDSIVDPIKKTFSSYKESSIAKDAQPSPHQSEPDYKYIPLKEYSSDEAVIEEYTAESSNHPEIKDATETTVTTAKNAEIGGISKSEDEEAHDDKNKSLEVVQVVEKITENDLPNVTEHIEIVSENLIKNKDDKSPQDNVERGSLVGKSKSMAEVNGELNEDQSKNLKSNQEETDINSHEAVKKFEAEEKATIIEESVVVKHTKEAGIDQESKDAHETSITTANDIATGDILSTTEEAGEKDDGNKTLKVVQDVEFRENDLQNFETQNMETASGDLIKNEDEQLNRQDNERSGISDLETNSKVDVTENKMLSLNEELNRDQGNNLEGNQEEVHINSDQLVSKLEVVQEKAPNAEETVIARHTTQSGNDQMLKETTEKNVATEDIASANEEGIQEDEQKTMEGMQELDREITGNRSQNFETSQIEAASASITENKADKVDLLDNIGKEVLDLVSNSKVELNVNPNMLRLSEEYTEGKSNDLKDNQEALPLNSHQTVQDLEANEHKISVIEDVTLQKAVQQMANPPGYTHSGNKDEPDEVDINTYNTDIASFGVETAQSSNLDVTAESLPQAIEKEEIKLTSDNDTVINETEKTAKDTENKQVLRNETAEAIKKEEVATEAAIVVSHDRTNTSANKESIIDEKVENDSKIGLETTDVLSNSAVDSRFSQIGNMVNLKDTSESEKSELIGSNNINVNNDKSDNNVPEEANKISFVADKLMQNNASNPVIESHLHLPKAVEEIETSPHAVPDNITTMKPESQQTVEETTDTSDQISDIVTEINDSTIDSHADSPINEVTKSVEVTDPSSTGRTTSSDILTTQENQPTAGSMEEKDVEVSSDKKVEDMRNQLSSSTSDSRSSPHDVIRIEIKDKSPVENLIQQEKAIDQRLKYDTLSTDDSIPEEKIQKNIIDDVSADAGMMDTSTDKSEITSTPTTDMSDENNKINENDTTLQADTILDKQDDRQTEHGEQKIKDLADKAQADQIVEEIASKKDIGNNEKFNDKETATTIQEIHKIDSPIETLLEENLHFRKEDRASLSTNGEDKASENTNDDDEIQAKIENIESEIETVLGKIGSVTENGDSSQNEIIGKNEIDGKQTGDLNSENSLEKHADKANDARIPIKPKMDSDNLPSVNGVDPIKTETTVDIESSTDGSRENIEENMLTSTAAADVSSFRNEKEVVADEKIQNNSDKQIFDGNDTDSIDGIKNSVKSSKAAMFVDATEEEHEHINAFKNTKHVDLSNDIKDDTSRNLNDSESNIINAAVGESKKQTDDAKQSSLKVEDSSDINKLSDKMLNIPQHEEVNQEGPVSHKEHAEIDNSEKVTEQTRLGKENIESTMTNVPKTQEQTSSDVIENEMQQQPLDEHGSSEEHKKEDVPSLLEDMSNNLTDQDGNHHALINHSFDEVTGGGGIGDNSATDRHKRDVQEVNPQDTTNIKINQTEENLINEHLSNTQLDSGSENSNNQIEEINKFEGSVPLIENDNKKQKTEDKVVEITKSDLHTSEEAKNLEVDHNLAASDSNSDAYIKDVLLSSDTGYKIQDQAVDETVGQTVLNDLSSGFLKTGTTEAASQQEKENAVEISSKDSKLEEAHTLQDDNDGKLQANNEENKLNDTTDGKLQESHKETKMQDDSTDDIMPDHESNKLEADNKIETLQTDILDNKLEDDHHNEKLQQNQKNQKMEDQKDTAEYQAPSTGTIGESTKVEEAKDGKEDEIHNAELTNFKQLSMLDSRKDNVIVQTKELGHDLSDDVSEQGLTSMQNEGSKDAVVLHSGPEVTTKASSKETEIDELENKKHGPPFYLHQDLYIPDVPSTFQEKKFAEALKLSTNSVKEEDNIKNKEGLLHSGEFHDSIPVNIASEPVKEPVTTQTNGIQCNIEHERNVPTSTVLVHSGELHDNILPLAFQMNQDPAGIEIVTYSNKYQTSAVVGGSADAQASSKDVSALFGRLDTTRAQSESAANPRNMDTEKRNNSAIVKKNMESEAATKIQASFRGYQVRKQLKNKLARDNITSIKRTTRRKSLGRIAEAKSANRQASDLEEQSATKIQAGIRGFLVRRRQKKTKPNSE